MAGQEVVPSVSKREPETQKEDRKRLPVIISNNTEAAGSPYSPANRSLPVHEQWLDHQGLDTASGMVNEGFNLEPFSSTAPEVDQLSFSNDKFPTVAAMHKKYEDKSEETAHKRKIEEFFIQKAKEEADATARNKQEEGAGLMLHERGRVHPAFVTYSEPQKSDPGSHFTGRPSDSGYASNSVLSADYPDQAEENQSLPEDLSSLRVEQAGIQETANEEYNVEKAEEKTKKEKAEEEAEKEYKERYTNAEIHDNLTRGDMKKDKNHGHANNPAPHVHGSLRPTYIKVNKKYLDPDTLEVYELPWEWDEVSFPISSNVLASIHGDTNLNRSFSVIPPTSSSRHGSPKTTKTSSSSIPVRTASRKC